MPKMTWDEIQQAVLTEIDAARHYIDTERAPDRTKRWDRYYGRPLGNEVKGRSKYISRDLMDTVEWTMPYVIRQFASGDPKLEITIKGQEPWVGSALMSKIQDDLSDGSDESLFRTFYEWFKDAFVSDTGFVKLSWALDYEKKSATWPSLGPQEMTELANDPEVQITGFDESRGPDGSYVYNNIKTRVISVRKYGLSASGMPHWEFICSDKCRSVNDEHPKGHQTDCTIDYLKRINRARGGKYFKNLDTLEKSESSNPYKPTAGEDTSEKRSYMNEEERQGLTMPEKGARGNVSLTEWFTRLDLDDNGYLEDVVVWMADRTMIRYEDNSEGIIPISSLSPILDCYRMFGISFSDLIVPLQNLKTLIFRRVLDNFDFTNLGMWISSDPKIDIRKLLNIVPGDLVRGDPSTTQRISPEPFNPTVLSLIEYIDTVKENRIGQTRYNQGMDANSLNKTATGIQAIMSAAHQRLELIARIFAETGLKDFYRKCVKLYQIYTRQPFEATVKGRTVQITPDMLQGDVVIRVNMGVEAEVGMVEAEKIQQIFGFLMAVDNKYPGAFGLENAHNLITRYVKSLGFRQSDDFVSGLQDWAKVIQGKEEQNAEMMKIQMIMADRKAKLDEGKLQLEAARAQGDLDTEDRRLAHDENKSELDARLKLLGMAKDERPQAIV